MREIDLVGLVCSRLCHDLISPVGALHNGLEVLAEDDDPDMHESAIELMSSSAVLAINRLKYYRLAFGGSGGSEFGIGLVDARAAVEVFFEGGRVSVNWSDKYARPDLELPKSWVKLLLNMVLVVGEAMPRGGELTIEVAASANQNHKLVVSAAGEKATLGDNIDQALRSAPIDLEIMPKLAPAVLVGLLAKEIGGNIGIVSELGSVTVEFFL